MYNIKLGYGCGIKATLLTPSGAVCDLRDARYVRVILRLPNGSTMPCENTSIDTVTNAVYIRLLPEIELTKIGEYGLIFNIKLDGHEMYSSPIVSVVQVSATAESGHQELLLQVQTEVTYMPANIEDTGYSPKMSTRGTWLVYNDNLKAFEDTGVATSSENVININGDVTNNPDNEDLVAEDDKLKFADKAYNKAAFSGLGRVYLRKNMVGGTNVLTQDMLSAENTIYIIQYDYDLQGEEITMPANCVLQFEGGKIINGTLIGQSTRINAASTQIFDTTTNLSGDWNIPDINALWFGAKGDNTTDNTAVFNKLFNDFTHIFIPKGKYVTGTINVAEAKYSAHYRGELHYANIYGASDTCLVYTGSDYAIKFNSEINVGVVENLTIVFNDNALGALYFDNLFYTQVRNIGIDNNNGNIAPNATGITLAGYGFSNIFTNIVIRYASTGIAILRKDAEDWLNNTQFGDGKGSIYIVRGDVGMKIAKGTDLLLRGVAIEYMSQNAVYVEDDGSLVRITVRLDSCYIEAISDVAFSLNPKGTTYYAGINLLCKNTEFHTVNIDKFCANSGSAPCFAKFEDCYGAEISTSISTSFVGNIIADVTYKDVHSAAAPMTSPSYHPFYETFSGTSKYNSHLMTGSRALGVGTTDSAAYTILSAKTLVKTVMFKSVFNQMRQSGGGMLHPIMISNFNTRGANRYIYSGKVTICRLPDADLKNSLVNIANQSPCCVECYPDGTQKVLYGESIWQEYGFTRFRLLPLYDNVEGYNYPFSQPVALDMYCYDNTQPAIDYNLLFIIELEVLGDDYIKGVVKNFGGEPIRKLRESLWGGVDMIYDYGHGWLKKDALSSIWRNNTDEIIYE